MKADDLRVFELLDFQSGEGAILFQDRRMMLYDADGLGILRRELIDTVGPRAARGLLTRLGYASGYGDAQTLGRMFHWDSLEEWCRAGPVLQALEGKAAAIQMRFDGPPGPQADIEIRWENCQETEQHVQQFGQAAEPVCWTLTGYASGYLSACLGDEVYFIETECCGTGGGCCRAEGRTRLRWGDTLAPHLEYFRATSVQERIARLEQALDRHRQAFSRERREAQRWREIARRLQPSPDIVARSRAMRDVLALAERVAPADSTVLLTGESGTGKEVIARLIHQRCRRAQGPFVAINCGALPEGLLESELFGHVRGAFTGATTDKPGLFEQAHGGTLFLDEVAELPPALQAKLLRALQEREIRRVGATQARTINVRVLAATNRDIEEAVAHGEFRRDLYYRLNVVQIGLPRLRDRRECIVPLARMFLDRYTRAQNKTIRGIAADALDRLTEYSWPGNVRELENVIERAVVLAGSDRLTVTDLPPALSGAQPPSPLARLAEPLTLADIERQAILGALERHGGNHRRTAAELGIGLRTLWRRLKEYGRVAEEPPGP